MPGFPKNLEAYVDCEEMWRKALSSPRGIEISFADGKTDYMYRKMCHYRNLLREVAKNAFPINDPAYGKSDFDSLKISHGNGVIRIMPYQGLDANRATIREL